MNIHSFGWELEKEVGAGRYKLIAFLTYCILKDVEGDSSAPEAQKPLPEGKQ